MRAVSFDLCPLSVLATWVKTSLPNYEDLHASWIRLQCSLGQRKIGRLPRYPELVERTAGQVVMGVSFYQESNRGNVHRIRAEFLSSSAASDTPEIQ